MRLKSVSSPQDCEGLPLKLRNEINNFIYFIIRGDINHSLVSSQLLNPSLLGTQQLFSFVWAAFNAHWKLEWILKNTTYCVEHSVNSCDMLGFMPHK